MIFIALLVTALYSIYKKGFQGRLDICFNVCLVLWLATKATSMMFLSDSAYSGGESSSFIAYLLVLNVPVLFYTQAILFQVLLRVRSSENRWVISMGASGVNALVVGLATFIDAVHSYATGEFHSAWSRGYQCLFFSVAFTVLLTICLKIFLVHPLDRDEKELRRKLLALFGTATVACFARAAYNALFITRFFGEISASAWLFPVMYTMLMLLTEIAPLGLYFFLTLRPLADNAEEKGYKHIPEDQVSLDEVLVQEEP